MSHNHSHGHDHHHDHSHDHHSSHEHEPTQSPLSFKQQLEILFDHWIKHNESHSGTYADWAEKARKNGLEKTAGLLDEIAEMTTKLNAKIEEAAATIK